MFGERTDGASVRRKKYLQMIRPAATAMLTAVPGSE
jgi:hypothetical protein